MNAQATVRARRVNNAPAPVGQHMTLIRCENDPGNNRVFAFAVSDDGTQVFVPSALILQHSIKPVDVGAGFTARTVPNPRANDTANGAPLMAQAPFIWDGESEEVVVDVKGTGADRAVTNEDMDALEAEFVKLAEGCDDMVTIAANEIGKAIEELKALNIGKATEKLQDTRIKLESFRTWIDEMAPAGEGD